MRRLVMKLLERRLEERSRIWLEEALETAKEPPDESRLLAVYTAISRKLGKKALQLNANEKQVLQAIDPLLRLDHWGTDEAGRALLLLTLAENLSDGNRYAGLVLACYENGDGREQQSWLRSLGLLPGCERFVDTATDACRTNVVPLFEAIACENPYPVQHFPELNFNQMVLKALFNNIAISRIVGLEERFNSELSRMADDYVSEREAAGRSVPADIWLVLAPCIPRERLVRVHRYLCHKNRDHRYWAALSLGFVNDRISRTELAQQRRRESDPELIRIIEASQERNRIRANGRSES